MRTNIDINDQLMQRAMAVCKASTKKGAVEAALQLMVRLNDQQIAIQELRDLGPWEGDLEAFRFDRVED